MLGYLARALCSALELCTSFRSLRPSCICPIRTPSIGMGSEVLTSMSVPIFPLPIGAGIAVSLVHQMCDIFKEVGVYNSRT